jgi:cyclopropane fatty-acyl-phospholipid synthase-like methyltransferase
MATQPRREEEAALAELAMTRVALKHTEDDWKDLRKLSKRITLELVTEHGLSVAKVAQLSGHTRQTIKIWLDVFNAEQKGRRNQN